MTKKTRVPLDIRVNIAGESVTTYNGMVEITTWGQGEGDAAERTSTRLVGVYYDRESVRASIEDAVERYVLEDLSSIHKVGKTIINDGIEVGEQ